MPIGRLRFCWDSCVFISLITEAGRTPDEILHLRELERLSDLGEIVIFTASITLVEVLACKMTEEQEKTFIALLKRTNVHPVSVTTRIAEKARDIRNHYRVKNLEIAVPDSIHLATAIQYNATALHTYDGCGKRTRPTDLLRLEQPIAGKYYINISKPEPPVQEHEEEHPKLESGSAILALPFETGTEWQ